MKVNLRGAIGQSLGRVLLGIFLALWVAGMAIAEESNSSADLDELFSASQDREVSGSAAVDPPVLPTSPENKPSLEFSGAFKSEGGLAIGFTRWPTEEAFFSSYDGSAGATASLSLSMKGRPSEHLFVYGSCSTSLDTTGGSGATYAWTPLALGSIYFDYYGIPAVDIRAGTFGTTWGHGRIFTLSNLMASSASDTTLRISFPLVLQGLSTYVTVNKAYFSGTSPTVYEYAYGALLDHIIGNLRFTEAVRYQKAEGFGVLLSIQGTVLGVDLFADGVLRGHSSLESYGFVGGLFKEINHTKFYGEYQFNSTGQDHQIGLVLVQKRLFAFPVDGGLQWQHSFVDGSGRFVPGLSWGAFPHMTIQAALPIVYGAAGSQYINNNEDPSKRRIMLVLLAVIQGSF